MWNNDIIFDLDGTLANASHRLHHIINDRGVKNWGAFLSDELVALDTPIPQTWAILTAMLYKDDARVIFVTGRPESQRTVTWNWLRGFGLSVPCVHRSLAAEYWRGLKDKDKPKLFMRKSGDRRPSSVTKREGLQQARAAGFKPTMAFEDQIEDAKMWRSEGLMCFQVAEGNY